MPDDVERLAILIEANTKAYENALVKVEQRTSTALARVEKQYADSGKRVDSFLAKIGTRLFAGGMLVAGGKAVAMFKTMVDSLGEVADAAERSGVSTDFIQALGFQVEQSGGSFEDAARAATKFGKELGDVNVKQSYLGRLLAANGVEIQKFAGDGQAAFEAYAKVVANAKTPQEALNMVGAVFGDKVGPKMVTTLREIGTVGMAEFIRALKEGGQVIDEQIIKKGDQIGDRWDALLKRMGNGFKSFVVQTVDEWELLIRNMQNQAEVPAVPAAKALSDLPKLRQELTELEQLAAGIAGAATSAINSKMYDGRIAELRQLIAEAEGSLANRPRITVNAKPAPSKNVPTTAPSTKLNEFERELKRLREQIPLMEKEAEVIDLGTYARERAMIVVKLETAAKEANAAAGLKNKDVTEAQRVKIEEMADAYATLAVRLEQVKGPLAEFAREGSNINLQLQNVVVSGLKGFEDAIIGVIQGTKTFKEAFRDMANAIIADLLRMAIRTLITAQIARLIGAFIPGFGGTGPGMPLNILPGRAAGGPVTRGQPYMVGERGPELFVPNGSGRVMSNRDTASGGPRLVIENHGVSIVPGRITADEVRVIARQVADDRIATQTEPLVASAIANPSSRIGKSMMRNTTSRPRR